MTKHALIILCLGGIVFALMARACARPAESQPPASATWAPAPFEPLGGRVWLPAAGDIRGDIRGDKTGHNSASYRGETIQDFRTVWATVRESLTVGVWGAWSWVDAAMAAGKPTAAPTPSATRTPTPTRPPRATRTARATGTPTQGRMATVPACGCNTPEPGPETPFPNCWPYGGTCAPTETPTPTPTVTPRDTPPASATWEPTPTPRVKATPITGGWVLAPEVHLYLFPILLVSRARR